MRIKSKKLVFLVGDKSQEIFKSLPFSIYDLDIISFLSELSTQLLIESKNNSNLKVFSYFAFWCRKSNLLRMRQLRNDVDKRYGRGLSLHIAPSNVVTNILFTMSFGLLSGCPTLIRVSPNSLDQIRDVFKIINNLFKKKSFKKIKQYLSIVTYEHDDHLNEDLSLLSDVRVIWGGNETVDYFKKIKSKSKTNDIFFPNRTSSAIITRKWLEESSQSEKEHIAKSFANDISLFSQRACSSPKSIYIYDAKNSERDLYYLLNDFFKKCDSSIDYLSNLEENQVLKNFKSASKISGEIKNDYLTFKGKNLFVIYLFDENRNYETKVSFENSCLVIYRLKDISGIRDFIDRDNQTIVEIGLTKQQKYNLIKSLAPLGTDRVVKPGMALNMDIFWDGYDIVAHMSRFIQFNL